MSTLNVAYKCNKNRYKVGVPVEYLDKNLRKGESRGKVIHQNHNAYSRYTQISNAKMFVAYNNVACFVIFFRNIVHILCIRTFICIFYNVNGNL